MRRLALCSLAFLSALLLCAPPSTGDDQLEFWKKKSAAIDKGIDWLKKQQKPDGSFDYSDAPFLVSGVKMVQGCTAFAAFALMKSGVVPNDPVVVNAFNYLQNQKAIDQCYSAGVILLAIEAKVNWEPPFQEEGEGEAQAGTGGDAAKKPPLPKKGKAEGKDLELAAKCLDLLLQKQQANVWRYPMGHTEDSSAAQYALLGLDAAERLGLSVPKTVYEKAQEWFVSNQEKDGPEVPAFPVPGADLSYKELKAIEKEVRDKIKKIDASFAGKKPGEVGADGHTKEDDVRTASQDASKKILKENGGKMKASGWCYTYASKGAPPPPPPSTDKKDEKGMGQPPPENELKGWKINVNGGMTASGLACLFICKAHLDGTANYEKNLKKPIDAALRDGAAWLAKNFTVSENPMHTYGFHHYYYLYGMERAGILGVVPRFGDHDWYDEGSKMFVRAQLKDGYWDAGRNGTSGPVVDTCFALLFLSRGTTPVVRLPAKVITGQGGSGASGKGQAEGAKYDNGD